MKTVIPPNFGATEPLQYGLYRASHGGQSVAVLNLCFDHELECDQLYPLVAGLVELVRDDGCPRVLIGGRWIDRSTMTMHAAVLELICLLRHHCRAVGSYDRPSQAYRIYASTDPAWPEGRLIESRELGYGYKLAASEDTSLFI